MKGKYILKYRKCVYRIVHSLVKSYLRDDV